jgi:hypothetical protein
MVNSSVANFSASNGTILNVSGINASYSNIYVGNLYSLSGTAYNLGGTSTVNSSTNFSATNASFVNTYVVNNQTVNSSTTNFSSTNASFVNIFGTNGTYSNIYVGNLYSLSGAAYNLSSSGTSTGNTVATNTSYITYVNNTSDMNISANNLIINSSTYISQNLQVFGSAKASSFQVTSDQRVKTNIEDLSRVTSLHTIRQLKPKIYDFIDAPKKQIGFIAQEIKSIDLLKPSIHEGPGFIPNIYRMVTCDQGRFTLDIPLKEGVLIRYKRNGKQHTTRILNVFNTSYQLEEEVSGEIFLYGTEVSDFHSMEKDMIFTLSVSAIQQLDELVTQQQKSIDELKALWVGQQKQIDQLLQKIDTILSPENGIM